MVNQSAAGEQPEPASGWVSVAWLFLAALVLSQPLLRFILSALLDRGGAFVVIHTMPFALQLGFCGAFLIAMRGRNIETPALPGYVITAALVWLTIAVFSVSLSRHPVIALARQAIWIEAGLFLLLAYGFFKAFPEKKERVLNLIWVGGLAYGVLLAGFIYQVGAGNFGEAVPSAPPGFGNVRHFGYYVSIVLVAGMAPTIRPAFKWNSLPGWLLFAGLVLVWSMTGWAGGRAPYFALGLGFIVLLSLRCLPRPGLAAGYALAAALAGGLLSLAYPLPNESYGFLRILGLEGPGFIGDLNALSTNRLLMWSTAWPIILDNPFFGVGPDLFPFEIGSYFSVFAQPHNFLVQFALAWGFTGAIALLLILQFLVRTSAPKGRLQSPTGRNPVVAVTAGAGVIVLLAFALVDGTLYHQVPLTLFLVFLALGASDSHRLNSRPLRGRTIPIIGLGIIALVLLAHGASVHAYRASGIPEPQSPRMRMIQTFPSSMWSIDGPLVLSRWADAWAEEDETAGIHLLEWAAGFARNEEIRQLVLARADYIRGDKRSARRRIQAARTAPRDYVEVLIEEIRDRYDPE